MFRRRFAAALAAALAATAFLACSGTDCREKTRFVEIEWGAWDEGIDQSLLDSYQSAGWDCSSEPLRNAFGTQFGLRWTCTKCD